MNEPIEEFETLLQDHMLLLRDLVRRCVAHKATLEKNRSFIKSGFDFIFHYPVKNFHSCFGHVFKVVYSIFFKVLASSVNIELIGKFSVEYFLELGILLEF